MFPLIIWKEKAICLQKLQVVVITFLLFNFLEEYLLVKRNLTTLISLRCTGNVHAQVHFFEDAFTSCVHINIRLKALIPADIEEMNFPYENN